MKRLAPIVAVALLLGLLCACSKSPDASGSATGRPAPESVSPPAASTPAGGPSADAAAFVPPHPCCESEGACCLTPNCCDLKAAPGEGCKSPSCPKITQ